MVRARRVRRRRLRVLPDGTGVVPDARTAARRIGLHLRLDPCRRARGDRHGRAVVRVGHGESGRRRWARSRGRACSKPRPSRCPSHSGTGWPSWPSCFVRWRASASRPRSGAGRSSPCSSSCRRPSPRAINFRCSSRSSVEGENGSDNRSAPSTRRTRSARSPDRSPEASGCFRGCPRPAPGVPARWRSSRSASARWRCRGSEAAGARAARRSPSAIAVPLCFLATGPTAVWRHSGIGAGRARATISSWNQLREWTRTIQRAIVWDEDGTESSVALVGRAGRLRLHRQRQGRRQRPHGRRHAGDARTARRHPEPRRATFPGHRPGHRQHRRMAGRGADDGARGCGRARALIVDIARACDEVNRDVLRNPKVRITIGDAREALLTARDQLRPHRVGAVEPVSRRRREPLHAGVLPGRQPAADRRRPLPAVGAALRNRRADAQDGLRDDRVGLSARRGLGGGRQRSRVGWREAAAHPPRRCARAAHPGGTVQDAR